MKINAKITSLLIGTTMLATFIAILVIWNISNHFFHQSTKDSYKKQLTLVRDNKAKQIQIYFQQIILQANNFANNYAVIDSMENFNSTFHIYGDQFKKHTNNQYQKNKIDTYLQNFNSRYKIMNGGESININSLINLKHENLFALQYNYVINNPYDLENKYNLNIIKDGTQYSNIHSKYHPIMKEFKKTFNFYDIMLVESRTGKIVYSVNKQIDFTTSIIDEPLINQSLRKVFNNANQSNKKDFVAISDFSSYIPSYGQQVAFIASPIFNNENKKIGVLILEIDISQINNIVTNNNRYQAMGLGNSGDIIITSQDKTARNINRLFSENKELFLKNLQKLQYDPLKIEKLKRHDTSIGIYKVEDFGVEQALNGIDGFAIYKNFMGEKVLSSYMPLKIGNINWSIVTQISLQEAFTQLYNMNDYIFDITVIFSIIMLIILMTISAIFTRFFSKSIQILCEFLDDINITQNFSKHCKIQSNDEIAYITASINKLIDTFKYSIENQNIKVEDASDTKTIPDLSIKPVHEDIFQSLDEEDIIPNIKINSTKDIESLSKSIPNDSFQSLDGEVQDKDVNDVNNHEKILEKNALEKGTKKISFRQTSDTKQSTNITEQQQDSTSEDSLDDLSIKLNNLAEQFKIFEEEADTMNSW